MLKLLKEIIVTIVYLMVCFSIAWLTVYYITEKESRGYLIDATKEVYHLIINKE